MPKGRTSVDTETGERGRYGKTPGGREYSAHRDEDGAVKTQVRTTRKGYNYVTKTSGPGIKTQKNSHKIDGSKMRSVKQGPTKKVR